MMAGPPALCRGTVWHRRLKPTTHSFRYDVTYVWFDPDHPQSITDHHWAWSTHRLRPAVIRGADYGFADSASPSERVREHLRAVNLPVPTGAVRFLTQPRRWGWLFNPISVYLAWPDDSSARDGSAHNESRNPVGPIGAVLEVTNTPWKEQHHYAVALEPTLKGNGSDSPTTYRARFDKALHVSPFLPADLTYDLAVSQLSGTAGPRLAITILVADADGNTVLETGMSLDRQPVDAAVLAESLRRDGFPTHRVSSGIHRQAAALLGKRVPFVPHPKRKTDHGHTGR